MAPGTMSVKAGGHRGVPGQVGHPGEAPPFITAPPTPARGRLTFDLNVYQVLAL